MYVRWYVCSRICCQEGTGLFGLALHVFPPTWCWVSPSGISTHGIPLPYGNASVAQHQRHKRDEAARAQCLGHKVPEIDGARWDGVCVPLTPPQFQPLPPRQANRAELQDKMTRVNQHPPRILADESLLGIGDIPDKLVALRSSPPPSPSHAVIHTPQSPTHRHTQQEGGAGSGPAQLHQLSSRMARHTASSRRPSPIGDNGGSGEGMEGPRGRGIESLGEIVTSSYLVCLL